MFNRYRHWMGICLAILWLISSGGCHLVSGGRGLPCKNHASRQIVACLPCYGYHPTCWNEWPECCTQCPPPNQTNSVPSNAVEGATPNPTVAPPVPGWDLVPTPREEPNVQTPPPSSPVPTPVETSPRNAIPEEAAPEKTVPQAAIPATAIPEKAVPEKTVPQAAIPETAIPEKAVPEKTVPQEAIPETAIPEKAVPEKAVPQAAIPETAIPEKAVPEKEVPQAAVPETAVPEKVGFDNADPGIVTPDGSDSESASWEVAPLPDRFSRTRIIRQHRVHRTPISLNRVVSFESDSSGSEVNSEVELLKQGWGSGDEVVFAPSRPRGNVANLTAGEAGALNASVDQQVSRAETQFIVRFDTASYARLWYRALAGTPAVGALKTIADFDPNEHVWRIDESAAYNLPTLQEIPSDAGAE